MINTAQLLHYCAKWIRDSSHLVWDSAHWVLDSAKWLRDSAKWLRDILKWVRDSAQLVRDSAQLVRDSAQLVRDIAQLVRDSAQWVRDSAQWVQDSVQWNHNFSLLRIHNVLLESFQLKYLLILQIKNIIELANILLAPQCIYCIKQLNLWTMYLTNFVVLKIWTSLLSLFYIKSTTKSYNFHFCKVFSL